MNKVEKIDKFQTPFSAFYEAKRLESFVDDKSLLPVYASSTAEIFPYQIAAAQFALRSDYLKGCILCDEGSLGKTYEALLIAGQKWYEGKENILVILPQNLVSQWIRKLESDFTIPFSLWHNSLLPPQEDGIVITTYDYALKRAKQIKQIDWDLVIFDEADALSKAENKTTLVLKDSVREAYKLLLTPTPITLSIMDIYGLIHFIDESVLPDADFFYKRYFRKPENYPELTSWVSQFCFRTLKVQTTEYVNFTNRIPIMIDYPLLKEERELYKLISTYLASDDKVAYPTLDNYNLNLLFYKSLSSSTQAFSNMLNSAIQRTYGFEKTVLIQIQTLANNIKINSKTTQLLKVLKSTFNHLTSMKVNQKAIIFVDNNTTLDVLYSIFCDESYDTLKYKDNATLEKFRNEKDIQILVTTDSAAKGLDIEYCPVVVNYDLLYNAIEMEQRICRCHRQGQKSDVLVINMLSKENFTDVRILQLINKRTLQFNGIFGMSDDIVGNFDTKIKEVLKDFRHRDVVLDSFRENLSIHKETNEKIVSHAEDMLFTTFTKSVADKITVTPKYIKEKIDEINQDLWDVVKYFFKSRNYNYTIDDEKKTLTCNDDVGPFLFYYWTGNHNKPYQGMQQYGLSRDFKPHYARITYTSPISRGVLSEIKWLCPKSGEIYVNKEIEACEIGFYEVRIVSKDGYLETKYVLAGQTQSGTILNEQECKDLLDLPIVEYKELENENYSSMENSFAGVGLLDFKISKDQLLDDYLKRKKGSFGYEIEKIKILAGRKKSNLEVSLNELKTEIKDLKKQIENGISDRFEELKITKKIKVLENELKKKSEKLFFANAQIDVETEEAIEELTKTSRFKVNLDRCFKVRIFGAISITQDEDDEDTRFRIQKQY